MVSVLNRVFSLAGSLGIVAPHAGHEAELLLSKKKPIGFLTVAQCPEMELSNDLKKDKADVLLLDTAVTEGKLSKSTAHIPPSPDFPFACTAHFYCQPGLEQRMYEVARFHEAIWNCRPPPALSTTIGAFLGYARRDIEMFERGGYDTLPIGVRVFMKQTHSIRKAARLASMRPLEISLEGISEPDVTESLALRNLDK